MSDACGVELPATGCRLPAVESERPLRDLKSRDVAESR